MLTALERTLKNISDTIKSTSAKWNAIEKTLTLAIDEARGVSRTMKLYREYGFSFSDRTFRNLYRDVESGYKGLSRVRYLNRDTMINETHLDPTARNTNAKYIFTISFDLEDELNEEIVPQWRTFETNRLMTRGELEQEIRDRTLQNSPDLETRVSNFRLRYGEINVNQL